MKKVRETMGARLLKIPADVVSSLHIPSEELEDELHKELHKELALALYPRGMRSSGKAAALFGMTRQQFEDLLGKRRIMRSYGKEELEGDLEYACSGL